MNELSEAEGGNLRGPGFSSPAEKRQEAVEPSGAKANDFSMNPGILVKLLTL